MAEFHPLAEASPPSFYSPEEFYHHQEWGAKSGLTIEELREIWANARINYDPELPAHNFNHACDTLWVAMQLADIAEAKGIVVNRKIIIAASLFHDARYGEDHTVFGYASKEAYSADAFAQYASNYRFTAMEIEATKNLILSTHPEAPLETAEQSILYLADLNTLDKDWQTFERRSDELKYEALNREDFNLDNFTVGSAVTLTEYLMKRGHPDIITPQWRSNAKHNLLRLFSTLHDAEKKQVMVVLQQKFGATAVATLITRNKFIQY